MKNTVGAVGVVALLYVLAPACSAGVSSGGGDGGSHGSSSSGSSSGGSSGGTSSSGGGSGGGSGGSSGSSSGGGSGGSSGSGSGGGSGGSSGSGSGGSSGGSSGSGGGDSGAHDSGSQDSSLTDSASTDTGADTGTDGATGSFDGTTGKACTSDTDCRPAGGPGVNKCTSDGLFGASGGNNLYPTAVCLDIQNCDPGTDGNLHFCDGPDSPSSPGVCLTTGTAGKGICLPQCNFKPNGSAATGCQGKDVCQVAGFEADPANPGAIIGIGYCFGGCLSAADCGTGQLCQTDSGLCLKTLTTDPAVGTGCNQNSTPAPTCNCLANTTTGLGFCAQFCKTGGTACPGGQICDTQLPTTLTGTNDASLTGWSTPNPGMGGFCTPTCVVDGGATGDAGGCYTNSTCQAGDVGGPDCLP